MQGEEDFVNENKNRSISLLLVIHLIDYPTLSRVGGGNGRVKSIDKIRRIIQKCMGELDYIQFQAQLFIHTATT